MLSLRTPVVLDAGLHLAGDVRQLENLIKRYVTLGTEDTIITELGSRNKAVFRPIVPNDGNLSLKKITRDPVREVERQVILQALQVHNWNRKEAAKALGISYRAILCKIRDAGLVSSHRSGRQHPLTHAASAD